MMDRNTKAMALVKTVPTELTMAEGWLLSTAIGTTDNHEGDFALRVERMDDRSIFESDDAAFMHVAQLAAQGSALHYNALMAVFLNNSTERRRMIDLATEARDGRLLGTITEIMMEVMG